MKNPEGLAKTIKRVAHSEASEDIFKKVELFQTLEEQEIRRLAQLCHLRLVTSGSDIFHVGQTSDALFVVREGAVLILRDTVGRPVQLLAKLERLDFFGELGLFDDVAHSTTARAAEDVTLLCLPKDKLIPFLDDYPHISLKLQMAAAKRHAIYAAAALELGRRQEVRIRVGREVELFFEDNTARRAVLDNLSPGGLALQHPPPQWKIGDTVSFRMEARETDPLEVSGRVSWQNADRLGIAFGELEFAYEIKIRTVLQQLVGRLKRLETS